MILPALVVAACALSGGGSPAQDKAEGGRRGKAREEVHRLIDDHIAKSLPGKVGLTDEQLARTLPLVRRLRADRRHFAERRMRSLFQMRRAVRAGAITDARAAEMLQELKAAEAEEAAALRAAQDAVDAVLDPVQRVRYRIFEMQIENRLRELMARVREQRREGQGRKNGDRPREASPSPP